jgi:hypothetical protein
MNIMIPTALVAVLAAAPALALDYNCSPLTGGCVPRASQPVFDPPYPPVVYVPPWPRSCPLDGPGAWSCDTRERRDRGKK